MDNNASPTPTPEADSAARRRSGRVVRAPTKFTPEAASQSATTKRKRDDHDEEDAENEAPDSDEEMSDETEEGSDDEHPAPRSRKKSSQISRAKKPSLKKPKTNGTQPARPAHPAGLPSRPKKSVRIDTGDKATGLFAELFGSGESCNTVAQQWLEKYRADEALALTDLVNCILQCAGCDQEVTEDDIRDPENIPNRLIDLQSVYQEQQITDYPLISKAKSTRSFRDMLATFFHTLISLVHEADILYKEDQSLVDNLHAWLASMSSSSLRPFRHTATTIALAVQSGLVYVADTLDERITNLEKQLQSSKRGKNKPRTAEFQKHLDEANGYRKLCSEAIQSFFDTVFVHRYRDIDPKIRSECVEALGSWIWDLPTVFMEPGYLRYLGWMLSDTHAPTRQEVLKQLSRVFRRDAQQLGHFIDRFRPRLIEMACRDSEVSVRVAAISVIDTLRAAAMLEPDEIDSIGKLIFDNELRIRKAVVGFFVSCVMDVHEGKIEEIGGTDALEELFDNVEDDNVDSPRQEWVNIKCLAETLAIYDAQIEEEHQNGDSLGLDIAADLLEATVPDTRISLASQVLYEKVTEIKRWGILAGYLLFDHTSSTKSKSKSKGDSTEVAFKKTVAPSSAEESILLDVLSSAVKSSLAQTADVDRNKKIRHRTEAMEAQEEIALELASLIPRLLSKFGAEPETAAIVLRLVHFLNLNVFQQLRQDATKYERLLDEISTQFNRHDDRRVLSEAATALLHSRQYDELEELTDGKLANLWENVVTALRNFDKTCELSVRGNLAEAPLKELSTILLKISKLSSISDCIDILEAEGGSDSSSSIIQILSNIVHRGKYEPLEDEIDELEDEVTSFAIKGSQFYFMWKTRSLSKLLSAGVGIADTELDRLSLLRQNFRKHLIETFSSRAAIDQLRLFATGSLCDLHLTFATLRPTIEHFRPSSSAGSQATGAEKYKTLVQEIEPGLVPELVSIFDGAERQYAKKSKKDKMLNEPAEDEDPMADDEDVEEDEDDENLSYEERFAAELKTEKALCELTAKYVLAIVARLVDNRGNHAGKLRRRLLRNQTKLGNNFKEVVAYLDERKFAERTKKKAVPATHPAIKPQKPQLSEEMVIGDDDIEDDVEDDIFDDEPQHEEGSREDLRRRELLEEDPIDDEEEEEEEEERPAHESDDDVLGD
ncbi:cohesin complex subunit [Neonectria magnoliae]|uniref:Cohesin complex subunit n=1 Tax=Neonectria magnoliae TaxID=2732573 RepID=A0ABR1I520_9HYPO